MSLCLSFTIISLLISVYLIKFTRRILSSFSKFTIPQTVQDIFPFSKPTQDQLNMIGVAKNFIKNMKNSYLPINVLLITITGLYSSEIKNGFLRKLYSLYRAACVAACILFSIWIIAGIVERGSFVLIEIMGTLLHFCM